MNEKERKILSLTVEHYLHLGTPISSGYIAGILDISVSPATIRNIMASLGTKGYLFQPHTSAGRIPSDKGLRFYVNDLFEAALHTTKNIKLSLDDLSSDQRDLDSYLLHVSTVLSEQSNNLGFVLSPRISRMKFKHLRFIKISEEKVMIILITVSDLVLTEIASSKSYFTQRELDNASQYLNENFSGKNLLTVREFLRKELPKYRVQYEDSIQKLISLLKSYIFEEEVKSQIFLQGTSKLLEKPELFQMERLQSLFQNFEQRAKLAKLLSDFISLDDVKVLIGTELNLPDISDCALVLSHYGSNNEILGSLGIIGPKRISYKHIIPLVNSVAKKLSATIGYSQ